MSYVDENGDVRCEICGACKWRIVLHRTGNIFSRNRKEMSKWICFCGHTELHEPGYVKPFIRTEAS